MYRGPCDWSLSKIALSLWPLRYVFQHEPPLDLWPYDREPPERWPRTRRCFRRDWGGPVELESVLLSANPTKPGHCTGRWANSYGTMIPNLYDQLSVIAQPSIFPPSQIAECRIVPERRPAKSLWAAACRSGLCGTHTAKRASWPVKKYIFEICA
jgi:hypothetical protein